MQFFPWLNLRLDYLAKHTCAPLRARHYPSLLNPRCASLIALPLNASMVNDHHYVPAHSSSWHGVKVSKLSASAVILISFLLLIQMVPGASSAGHVSNDLYIADMNLIQFSYDSPTIIKNKPVALPLVVINTFQESMYTDFRIDARYNDRIADRPRARLILIFPLPE